MSKQLLKVVGDKALYKHSHPDIGEWLVWEARTPRTARPLDLPPVVAPVRTVPSSFSLFPAKSTARNARGRAIDELLAKHLGGRRRR